MTTKKYAVEYRNMRTAIHGLMIFGDEERAYEVDDILSATDTNNMDPDSYEELLDEILSDADMYDHYDEINFRDVEWSDDLGEYVFTDSDDDEIIIVVNTEHEVHDLYI